jgi:phosphatidylglycerol:prolipoprotein diacylglycerol transferase
LPDKIDMIPILFEIGPLKIGSFGVMVAIAFLACAWVLRKEFKRKGFSSEWANNVVVIGAVSGIVGSRIYFLFEEFDSFINDPLGMIFSGSGLTWYGGFILAIISLVIYIRKLPAPSLELADLIAPVLLLGYGIGRIGCLLSGDGDYGPPSDLPWAMAFPKGLIPTDVPVHPTPIYETLLSLLLFFILWHLRKKNYPTGLMVSGMLIFYGFERFVTEFWRLNPKALWGLSMAQLFSILSIAAGIVWAIYLFNQEKSELKPVKTTAGKKKKNSQSM